MGNIEFCGFARSTQKTNLPKLGPAAWMWCFLHHAHTLRQKKKIIIRIVLSKLVSLLFILFIIKRCNTFNRERTQILEFPMSISSILQNIDQIYSDLQLIKLRVGPNEKSFLQSSIYNTFCKTEYQSFIEVGSMSPIQFDQQIRSSLSESKGVKYVLYWDIYENYVRSNHKEKEFLAHLFGMFIKRANKYHSDPQPFQIEAHVRLVVKQTLALFSYVRMQSNSQNMKSIRQLYKFCFKAQLIQSDRKEK